MIRFKKSPALTLQELNINELIQGEAGKDEKSSSNDTEKNTGGNIEHITDDDDDLDNMSYEDMKKMFEEMRKK